ncbi:MAG: hypothetical protein RLZZ444_4394 [Pseudomonadota bacterium]|jgi:CubicO group peptidase (beta-lactamase class C family)
MAATGDGPLPDQETTLVVSGTIAPGYEAIAETFADNFATRNERGASLHIRHRGQMIVDLHGGWADAGRPWTEKTVGIIFSATKAATALCIHLLNARDKLDLDGRVADHWPDYGAHGKEATTIRMVLDHTAGVPAIRAPLPAHALTDHDLMAAAIAEETPFFPPGSRTAYHPVTGGYILAELVRRIDGRSLGRFFAEEIAGPLGLDFWIGLPEAVEPRVAPIEHFRPTRGGAPTAFGTAVRETGSLQNLFFFNHGDWMASGVNTRAGRAAEIGAASGVTNARGLAELYDAMRPDGALGLGERQITGFSQATSATHCDGMLLQPTRFGPGFMLAMDNDGTPPRGDSFRIGPQAFGHVGAGGSFGFRDPDLDLAMAYTMNRMGPGFLVNPRGQTLIDATYACLNQNFRR